MCVFITETVRSGLLFLSIPTAHVGCRGNPVPQHHGEGSRLVIRHTLKLIFRKEFDTDNRLLCNSHNTIRYLLVGGKVSTNIIKLHTNVLCLWMTIGQLLKEYVMVNLNLELFAATVFLTILCFSKAYK